MKKLLLLITVVLSCGVANAQISLGIKGGVNYASLYGVDATNPEAIIAYHGGGVVELGLGERFSLQPEVLYSAQGGTFRDNILGTDIENTFNYILLPVLAKVYIIKGLSLEIGPQIGFNISSETKFLGLRVDKDFAENLDYGMAAGAGFKLENGLFFQGRYNLGLAQVDKTFDYKNSVFALSVGFFLLNGSN